MIIDAVMGEPDSVQESEGGQRFGDVRMMRPVRLLLDHFEAPMMTVALHRERAMVAPWTLDGTVAEEISDALAARHGLSQALDEARLHDGAVCALVARRWPANCLPPIVGVVTDGHGVAVSGGHPCGLTPDWLIDHVAGRARVHIIMPFAASATLLLQPATSVARRH